MKLAFSGNAHYPTYDSGYERYLNHKKTESTLTKKEFCRVVREYCKLIADKLVEEGMVDLPSNMGTLTAVRIDRKPQYRGKKFIGYGKKNWNDGTYDGSKDAFGVAYLPNHSINANLRCFGFVSNRELFKKIKNKYEEFTCSWVPLRLTDEMI